MLTTAATVGILISATTIIARRRSGDATVSLLYICVKLDHFLSGMVRVRAHGSAEVGAEQELEGQG